MTNFYFLACLLILFRVAYQVVWWRFLLDFWTFFFLYGQTLKFLIGIQQTWINVELILSIRHSLLVIEDRNTPYPVRLIRVCRMVVIVFTTSFAICAAAICFYWQSSKSALEN